MKNTTNSERNNRILLLFGAGAILLGFGAYFLGQSNQDALAGFISKPSPTPGLAMGSSCASHSGWPYMDARLQTSVHIAKNLDNNPLSQNIGFISAGVARKDSQSSSYVYIADSDGNVTSGCGMAHITTDANNVLTVSINGQLKRWNSSTIPVRIEYTVHYDGKRSQLYAKANQAATHLSPTRIDLTMYYQNKINFKGSYIVPAQGQQLAGDQGVIDGQPLLYFNTTSSLRR